MRTPDIREAQPSPDHYATLGQLVQGETSNHPVPGTEYSVERAQAEGWDVFDCGLREDGSRRIELQRLDDPPCGTPVFKSDEDAWRHVVIQARSGSELHIAALRMIDPVERALVTSACGWCQGV